jgi:hypothetical protein
MYMTTDLGRDEPGNGHERDQTTVGWQAWNPVLSKSAVSPIEREKTDAERAAANMFKLAENAGNFEDSFNNFERAVKICREYGIQTTPPPPPSSGGGAAGHQARMDAARIAITIVLVIGVLGMVGWSLTLHNASTTAEYIAPISGLAGIGLGWLFTNQPSPPSPKS